MSSAYKSAAIKRELTRIQRTPVPREKINVLIGTEWYFNVRIIRIVDDDDLCQFECFHRHIPKEAALKMTFSVMACDILIIEECPTQT